MFDAEVVAAEDMMLMPSLSCHRMENDWLYVDNGTFYLSTEAEQRHGGDKIICECTPLMHIDDFPAAIDKLINRLKKDYF